MGRPQLDQVFQKIRHWLGQRADSGLTDGVLLERFIGQNDATAFEALVQRHGSMVLDVCRSLLANEHDAEDAFQATFLVLARQATSIRRLDSVGSWLYGVAHRTSLRGRANAARRRFHESQVVPMSQPDETPEADTRELRCLLHEELERLPEKYRAPLVLCFFQGKTNEQAATELGWPKGTVQTRIARGRDQLRKRLAGRGVALSLAALTASLTPPAQALSPRLVTLTVEAAALFAAGTGTSSTTAATLAEEVSHMMRTSKLMMVATLVCGMGLLAVGGGLLLHSAAADRPNEKAAAANTAAPAEPPAAIDRYGDPLPPGAVVRLGTPRLRPNGANTFVTYSPDGRLLASWDGQDTGGVRLWDARSGKALLEGNLVGGDVVAFAPDGKLLAAARTDSKAHPSQQKCEVVLWQTDTGKEVRRLATDAHRWINNVPARITALAFSPDGKSLAAGGDHPDLWLWDTTTGKEIRRLPVTPRIGLLAFEANGETLLSVGQGDGVRWWDVSTGKERRHILKDILQWQYAGSGSGMAQVSLSPDQRVLAWTSPGMPFQVRRWDLTADRELPSLQHPNGIQSVAFSPDGKLLATSGWDRGASPQIRIWDTATGKEVRQSQGAVNPYNCSLAFTPDSKTLASSGADPVIRLWEVASGKEIELTVGHLSGVSDCFFLADGKSALTVGWEGSLRLWETATGKPLPGFAPPQPHAWAVAVSADGQTIGLWCPGNVLVLLDAQTGKEIRRWNGHPGGVQPRQGRLTLERSQTPRCLTFSPDGKYLAAGSYDGTVPIWETATGKEHRVLALTRDFIYSIAFAPDGKTLAAGSGSEVVLADVASGKKVRTWGDLPGLVKGLAFVPNGKTLAAGAGNELHLWTVASGESRLHVQEEQAVNSVAFSPDGRTLAACSGSRLRLWELATNGERQRFTDPSGGTGSVTYSPDGKSIATISRDGTVLLWGHSEPRPAAPR